MPRGVQLAISANGRYFTNFGQPFFLRGDTPWELTNRSPANIGTYLSDRKARGFNALILEGAVAASWEATNYNGDAPFTGTVSSQPDISTPNEPYWNHVAYTVGQCDAYGFQVFITVLYAGFPATTEGFYPALVVSNNTAAQNFGAYLAGKLARYKNWIPVLGGDYYGNGHADEATVLARYEAIATGIESVTPGRIYSWHAFSGTSSYEVPYTLPGSAAGRCNWAYAQEDFSTPAHVHEEVLDSYNDSPTVPVFFGEGHYEGSTAANADSTLLVRQFWNAACSVACGTFFGNETLWQFSSGWENTLGSAAVLAEVNGHKFIAARQWWRLAPSTGTGLVTAGGGTIGTDGYRPRALADDGSFGIVFCAGSGTVTINESLVNGGTFTARWFDPVAGTYSSAVGSSGVYTPPAAERVLVLEKNPA